MAGIRRGDVVNTAPNGSSIGREGNGQGLVTGKGSRYSSMSLGQWEPTVVYLLLLTILEIFAYAGLRYLFRSVHGG